VNWGQFEKNKTEAVGSRAAKGEENDGSRSGRGLALKRTWGNDKGKSQGGREKRRKNAMFYRERQNGDRRSPDCEGLKEK